MPGNPPAPAALPAPLPLPSAFPVPDPVPVPAADPRPLPDPSTPEFRPAPVPLPYFAPLPTPDALDPMPLPPPDGISAIASPLALSDGVPLPVGFELPPPPFEPAEGSAISVDSPGATANRERASPSGTFAITSGGGGIAFKTSRPCWPRLFTGTSDGRAGCGIGFGGGARRAGPSSVVRSGIVLNAATGSDTFGALTSFSTGRIASRPD